MVVACGNSGPWARPRRCAGLSKVIPAPTDESAGHRPFCSERLNREDRDEYHNGPPQSVTDESLHRQSLLIRETFLAGALHLVWTPFSLGSSQNFQVLPKKCTFPAAISSEIPTVRGLDESATYHHLAFLYMGRKSKKVTGESHSRPDAGPIGRKSPTKRRRGGPITA